MMQKIKLITPEILEDNLRLVQDALNNLPAHYNLNGIAALACITVPVAANIKSGLSAHPAKVAALAAVLVQLGVLHVDDDGYLSEIEQASNRGAA
ncbi:hypothetical protein JXA32_16090 [Candidatus Sumerlaeota bacterium]|nr:hypothetical protein [Candidatus Sumerlaeota bacterium]